jgi:MATE family multidrug resistance protein
MPLEELTVQSPHPSPFGIPSGLATLARLALPMIVSRAGLAAMGIADAIMVSRFSSSEFAALSLADGTLGRVIDIFAAFIIGGLVLVPRAHGAGDMPEALRIWRRSVLPAISLGLLGLVIGLLGTTIFRGLGQSGALASYAGKLSVILGIGYMAALLAIGAAIFLEGIRRPVLVAVSVVLANVLNIALNWLLIGGHLGFPALGARGSAISTTLVRFALAMTLVVGVLRVRSGRVPAASEQIPPNTQHALGLSAAAVQAIMLVLTASLLVFAGWMGPLPLAVLSAVWTLNAPVMLISLGLADATGIRVASEQRQSSSRFVVILSLSAAAFILMLFIAVWSSFPGHLAAVFTADPSMLKMLVPLIPLASALLLFDSLSFVVVSALRALHDIVWPTGIEIATMAALVPLAYWLAFSRSLAVRGLLLAAVVSAACRLSLLAWRFLSFTKNPITEKL